MDPNLITADQFPTVAGRSEEPPPPSMKPLKEVEFQDRPGDLLAIFRNLYPETFKEQVEKLNCVKETHH